MIRRFPATFVSHAIVAPYRNILPVKYTGWSPLPGIPLPPPALEWLRELHSFSGNSKWVLPVRKMQHRMIPHIQESTLPVALAKVRREMPDVPNFTVHDFRRTARTHLAALGVNPIVAERCLNHRIKGVEGIYNRHQYFDERRAGLALWADLLVVLERG